MVIDTPEAAARLESLFTEDVHYISAGTLPVPINDPEVLKGVIKRYGLEPADDGCEPGSEDLRANR